MHSFLGLGRGYLGGIIILPATALNSLGEIETEQILKFIWCTTNSHLYIKDVNSVSIPKIQIAELPFSLGIV